MNLLSGANHEYWLKNEYGGDDTGLYEASHPEYYAANIGARIAIIDALGGDEAVKKIPFVAYPILCSTNYLRQLRSFKVTEQVDYPSTVYMSELEQIPFPKGASIVQTEDPAGRKALVLQLVDKTNPHRIVIERIFQRSREACILPNARQQDGSCWISKILSSKGGANQIAEELSQVVQGTHPRYELKAADSLLPRQSLNECYPITFSQHAP